ncbi:sensor histidine kinase [Tahibacter harae]|uniref:Histidine kinase n=1 Tax=Tahibacter harae TaxID=2963937 RepID=A0ABT1QMR4_9GAMM|nr:sensor histidine kinase [Tahibacter harae]MCQ4163824.1 histidine kinase [Tahibacter harae]
MPAVPVWQRALCAVLMLLVSAPVPALDPAVRVDELLHTGWTVQDGAPADITALAQTGDGFLWLGTPTGLYRFDGIQFERVAAPAGSEFPSQAVSALWASGNALWIGFRYGGASLLRDGRLYNYGEAEGFSTGTVFGFAQQDDGRVWAATYRGLLRRHGETWTWIGAAQGFPGRQARAVLVDSAGAVWAASEDAVYRQAPGAAQFREVAAGDYPVSRLAEDRQGRIWAAQPGAGLRRLKAQPGEAAPAAALALPAQDLAVDRDGGYWIATPGDGLRRLVQGFAAENPAVETYTEAEGLTANFVRSVLEDREGSLWFGTAAGLDRLRRVNLLRAPFPQGAHDFALAADSDGSLWAGTRNEPLLRLRGRQVERSVDESFGCAYRDAHGQIWLGGRSGIWQVRDGKAQRVAALPPQAAATAVQALARDADGVLWVSLNVPGVFTLADGLWTHRRDAPELLARASPLTLLVDRAGRRWLGFSHNRIVLIGRDGARVLDAGDGLDLGNVSALHEGAQRLWAGGARGLAYAQGERFRTVQAREDGLFHGISGIVETVDGDLWLHAARGALRIPAAELRRALDEPGYRVAVEIHDALDGMPGAPAQFRPLPTLVQDGDGRLWFATTGGVAMLDPRRRVRNVLAPPVLIRSLDAGGAVLSPGPDLRFPAHTTALRIRYVGNSLAVPERVRFRSLLQGLDADWQDMGGRREAAYTNLGPGRYRFQVIAANDSGVWNTQGAGVDFVIEPAWFQTGLFRAALGAFLLLAAVLLYRWRLRQIARRLRAQNEVRQEERERIARELHDTLLQGVQGLLLRFQAAAERVPDAAARRGLEQALDVAEQVLAEGRDRVMELRPAAPPGLPLAEALQAVALEQTPLHACGFELSVAGRPRALLPAFAGEVYCIAREALVNAYRHAAPATVLVLIDYGEREFRLRICDDGRGLDDAVLRAGGRSGHFGLASMRERAERLGARLSLRSRAGAGTEIELRSAAARSYALAPRRGLRWRR